MAGWSNTQIDYPRARKAAARSQEIIIPANGNHDSGREGGFRQTGTVIPE